jgi:AraC family transcriptional regulator
MGISREQYLLNRRRFRCVMDYLHHHLDDEDIRLETLAEVASLSRFHFQRMYAERVRETPMATVRRLRLVRVRQLLLDGNAPSITTLAAQAGYGSVAAFSRAFSRAFDHSPTAVTAPSDVSGSGAGMQAPKLEIVSLPAMPVVRHPFTGRAADVFNAGDDFTWIVARSDAWARGWRHWAVHPDGWVDPVRSPDAWVRMWHCAPSGSLPLSIPGAERGYLPPGSYARFVLIGRYALDIPQLIARVAAETPWQVVDGPMLRHYPNVPDYTPVSERITHFYLAVAPR